MLRTTLIRGGLLAVLVAVGATAWWAQSYVRPEAVRATVLSSFQDQFPDAHVQVGEAHLRVFGGVSVRDLTLSRSGDDEPFFSAPTAVIVHDKEELSGGRMVIRKIELDGATLRLERRADGRWTFDGLAKPSPADRPLPMFVVTHGKIILTDKSSSGLPPLTFSDANVTFINDPPPLFMNVKGTAMLSIAPPGAAPIAPVRVDVSGRLHRLTGEFSFHVGANDLALGPDLAAVVKIWKPELAEKLGDFRAAASVKADIGYKPDAAQPLTYDLDVKLRDGSFTYPLLPVPVEAIEANLRYKDGKLSIEKATAKLGTCTAELSLESRQLPSAKPALIPAPPSGLAPGTLASTVRTKAIGEPDPLADLEQNLEKLDLTLHELTLSDELYAKLGERIERVRKRFQPVGVIAISYHFNRPNNGGWRRVFELKPTRFGMTYENFRYPLTDIAGAIRKTTSSSGIDETTIDLTGTAGGQRIDVKGTVTGGGEDPGIDLRITGNNVPVDDRLFEALSKPKHQQALKKLRAVGRGDFVAEVKQEAGVNLCESVFRFKVYDAKFSYTQFPYPLDKVAGMVTVNVASMDATRPLRPGQPKAILPDTDRVVLSEFTGKHGNGTVSFHGINAAIPGETDHKFALHVAGQNCPIDVDLKAALAAIKLDAVWSTFSPRGAITFAVDVDIANRTAAVPAPLPPPFDPATPPGLRGTLTSRPRIIPDPPFNPATDLALTMHFTGPSITPDFFPYDLDAVAGAVRYDGTQVRVEKFTAKHGTSVWALDAGEVRFFKDGRVWANIGRLDVSPLVTDELFLKALPASLQKAAKELNLRGPADLSLKHLVVLTPPDAPRPLQVLSPSPPGGEGLGVRGDSRVDSPFIQQTGSVNAIQSPSAPAPHPYPSPPRGEGNEQPDPDIYWTGELHLDGASLEAGVAWDKVKGRIASTGRYYGTHLGEVIGNIWLDEASAADHPFRNLKFSYRANPQTPDPYRKGEWEPVAVRFADITGQFFGGTVGGEARVVLSDPVRYRMRLDATEIRLEELAKHHNLTKTSRIEGTAQASLRLETVADGTGKFVLDGAGTMDVDHAHLLNLPFLLPLLKTLKLQAPDKTAFEEAHAAFTIRGNNIHVTHLDLLGDALSIGGSGDLDLQGEQIKFDCYTILSQTLQRWLTTPLGDVTAFVSEKLFRIEISRGPDGLMKYDARLVPFMTDPVRALADRIKNRRQAEQSK